MQGFIFSLIFIDKLSVRGSVTHLKLNNYWAVDLRLTPRSGQVHGHSISLDTYPASAMLSFILRNLYTIEKFLSLPISGIVNISVFSECVCVCVCAHIWLLATLWIVTRQVPLSMGFSRQESWSELPFSFPGYLSDPGIKPVSSVLYLWATGEAPCSQKTTICYFVAKTAQSVTIQSYLSHQDLPWPLVSL